MTLASEYPVWQADHQSRCQKRTIKQVHEGKAILTVSRTERGTTAAMGMHPIIQPLCLMLPCGRVGLRLWQ